MPNPLNSSVLSLFLSSGIAARVVLTILAVCSVLSWGMILYKGIVFRRATKENRRFIASFTKSVTLYTVRMGVMNPNDGPFWRISKSLIGAIDFAMDWERGMLRSSEEGPSLSSIERTLRSALQEEMTYYEQALHLLATIGNTAPFIGLFGTVWGIMNTFRAIGLEASANMAVVAPGIAEALITTAAGLAAAIPAVVAYNLFVQELRILEGRMELFVSDMVTEVEAAYRLAPSKQGVFEK